MGETEWDGVVLRIILDNVELSTRLGLEDLEEELSKLCLRSTNGDLRKLLDSMEDTCQ